MAYDDDQSWQYGPDDGMLTRTPTSSAPPRTTGPIRPPSIPAQGPVPIRGRLRVPVPGPPPAAEAAEPVRRAGTAQGLLLMAGSSVPVLGGVLVAPLLPMIAREFATTPGVAVLVPLVVGITGLSIALVSPFAGALVDRLGRTRLLVASLVVVAVAGSAPAFLPGLPLILASRAVLGMAEAVVFTCCTTLIGDYFPGEQRDRWLGWQVVATSLSATVFFVVGGALGENGWRGVFLVYAGAVLLAPLMARLLPDPAPAATAPARRPVPWRLLVLPCGLTLVTSTLFYVVPTQLSFLLADQGIRSTQTIGIITGGAALATAIGGFFVGNLGTGRPWLLLPVECAVTAAGLLLLGLSGDSLVLAANGAMLASVGGGMLVATLLIWTMRVVDVGIRGLGAGAWSAAFFLGQFVGSAVVPAVVAGAPGGLQGAVTVLGIVGVVLVPVTIGLGVALAARRTVEHDPPPAAA